MGTSAAPMGTLVPSWGLYGSSACQALPSGQNLDAARLLHATPRPGMHADAHVPQHTDAARAWGTGGGRRGHLLPPQPTNSAEHLHASSPPLNRGTSEMPQRWGLSRCPKGGDFEMPQRRGLSRCPKDGDFGEVLVGLHRRLACQALPSGQNFELQGFASPLRASARTGTRMGACTNACMSQHTEAARAGEGEGRRGREEGPRWSWDDGGPVAATKGGAGMAAAQHPFPLLHRRSGSWNTAARPTVTRWRHRPPRCLCGGRRQRSMAGRGDRPGGGIVCLQIAAATTAGVHRRQPPRVSHEVPEGNSIASSSVEDMRTPLETKKSTGGPIFA